MEDLARTPLPEQEPSPPATLTGNPTDSSANHPAPSGGESASVVGERAAAPPMRPVPLLQAIQHLPGQYWKAISKPAATTFAREAGKAAWGIILLQVLGSAVIVTLLRVLQEIIGYLIILNFPPSPNTQLYDPTRGWISTGIGWFFLTLVLFLVVPGCFFAVAKVFGGQGGFRAHVYSTLLYLVPLSLAYGLIGLVSSDYLAYGLIKLVPALKGVLGFLIPLLSNAGWIIALYAIVVAMFMVKGVHRLSGGKAAAVVLISIGGGLFLFGFLFFLALLAYY